MFAAPFACFGLLGLWRRRRKFNYYGGGSSPIRLLEDTVDKKTKVYYGTKIAAMIAEGSGYTPEAAAVKRLAESFTRLPSDDLYFLDLLMALKNGTYAPTTTPEER